MYNGVPLEPIPNGPSPSGSDILDALLGRKPLNAGQNPQTQALTSAIAGSESMEPTTAPMGRQPWGMMTPEAARAEVAGSLPGRTQDVAGRQVEAERARALSPEAPALSFMGMPVMGAGEAQEATARNLAEAQAKKAHVEAQLAGEADLPTTTPLRNAAETAFQSAGTSYASVPKFAGYIGGWLANEAGADIHPADNAVFRLGDQADKWAKEAFPGDPARQDEFGTKAAHLAGFLATLHGAGGVKAMTEGGSELAAKLGDAVSKASQASLMAGTGGMGQFEGATKAMEAGQAEHPLAGVTLTPQGLPVSERDRAMATLLGAGVGLTTLMPMASALATAGERESGAILSEALKGSGVGAGQMAAFNVLNNAIAREYYDPKRPLTQGLEDSAGLGALLGGVTRGTAAVGPKRLSTPEEVRDFVAAAHKSDPDPAKAAYWGNMHDLVREKLPQLPAPGAAPKPPAPKPPAPAEPPRDLADAGPYALRDAANWREEAHAGRSAALESSRPVKEGDEPPTTDVSLRGVHATDAEFDKFDPAKTGSRFGLNFWGDGVYMSPLEHAQELGKATAAGTYYGERPVQEGSKHYLLSLEAKKPFVVDHDVNEFGDIHSAKADWESLRGHGWEHGMPPVMAWDHPAAMQEARASIPETARTAARDASRARDDAIEQMWGLKSDVPQDVVDAAKQRVDALSEQAAVLGRKAKPEAVLSEKFTNALKSAGYDSVIVKQNGKPYEMLAVQPGTVKTAHGGEPMYALRGFYNPATRAVEESKQGAMPGDQWLKMLQGAAQKGVQKRHLEELGVPDYLEGKGKVTKQELLDHMRINEAPLEEKIHEDLTPEEHDFQSKWWNVPYHSTPQDVRDKLDDIEDKGPKFSSYSPFPSGKNNREFVIRDPRSEGQYDEPHYGGPVALHIRTWDLDGPNGEKILGVAEIQSTLHQKGRSEGYGVGFSDENEKRLEELGPIRDRLEREYNATPNYDELSPEEKARLYQPLSDVYREIDLLDALQSKEPVPKAALSDSWLDVGMKRALQYAAENGYDGVTWAKSGQIASAVGAKPEALAADYDKKIPSWFQKIAKKYGAGSSVVTTGEPQEKSLMTAISDYDKPLSDFVRFRIQMNYYNIDRVLSEFREIGDPNEISQAEDLKSWWDQRRYVPEEQNTFIRINDKMRDDIMAKGMPLAAAPDRVAKMMESSLKAGKPVDISTSSVNQVHKAIAPMRHVVPESTGIHVLSRIEPHEGKLLATFTDQDGEPFHLVADAFSDLSNLRGLTADDGAKIIISNIGSSQRAREVMPASAGEIGADDPHTGVLFHEGVHSLYRLGRFPADDWSRLTEHASSFNLMDMPINQYLTSIGEKSNPADSFSLRDIYELAYKDIPAAAAKSLIEAEEPVAHMMELFHHGHFTGEQMQPVADLLQKFTSGEYAKGAEPSMEPENRGHGQSLDDVQGDMEGKIKALYGSEFPKKDPEDFGTHGWWALGEGKSSYGDKEVLDRIREKHPDLVGKYKEAYKANRDARFNDVFEKAGE